MVFPEDFEKKCGFSSVRSVIAEYCETRLGKEEVYNMSFTSNFLEITKRLKCVDEMVKLISGSLQLPEFKVHDVLPWLSEIKIPGTFLSGEQLGKVSTTLKSMESVRKFFIKGNDEDSTTTPFLKEEFSNLPVLDLVIKETEKCIDRFGEVKDTASPELNEIRSKIRSATGSMQRILRRIMERAINEGIVEKDASPSLRDGRMVIPVSAGLKNSINGIVHDQSSTGKTYFIEPAEVVEEGNRIRELELQEKREIAIILIRITDLIRPEIEEIEKGCFILAKYDFIKAKARYAVEINGELPILEKKPEIDWYHAVHPGLLLNLRKQDREAIPLYISLDKKHRILIISGPNAGGKSVCLKTVAIIQYMTQCGVLPSLHSNSHLGIFHNLFLDIGDQQSIENDLSTYSSHLSNMKFFLKNVNSNSLVLADEMGSGTEPQIGGALAQAILKIFGDSGCFGVITTHYQNLKSFAETEPGFLNGAMLYDRQHLQPTFQLSIGNAGSSFALEIARKIGLPTEVVDYASELVGKDYVNSDKYLMDIQRDRRYWQNKRLDIKEKEHRLDKLLETYESNSSELKSQRNAILKAAKDEAKEILAEANARIERSIHEIRKANAEKEKTKQIRLELTKFKEALQNDINIEELPEVLKPLRHESKKSRTQKKKMSDFASKDKSLPLGVGDYVKIENGGVVGKILSIEGKKAEVAFGALRTIVDISKLKLASQPATERKRDVVVTSSISDESRQRHLKFNNEIDVRGLRADEAIQAVIYFMDDAVQFNAKRLRILHGTGHGILKTLIRQQLKANPHVSNFEDEDVRFGGAGITVVDLE